MKTDTHKNRRWTPLHIELMLHYFCTPSRHKREDAPAVIEYTQHLLNEGLIATCKSSESGYGPTDKGAAFVERICNTPLPEQIWV